MSAEEQVATRFDSHPALPLRLGPGMPADYLGGAHVGVVVSEGGLAVSGPLNGGVQTVDGEIVMPLCEEDLARAVRTAWLLNINRLHQSDRRRFHDPGSLLFQPLRHTSPQHSGWSCRDQRTVSRV